MKWIGTIIAGMIGLFVGTMFFNAFGLFFVIMAMFAFVFARLDELDEAREEETGKLKKEIEELKRLLNIETEESREAVGLDEPILKVGEEEQSNKQE